MSSRKFSVSLNSLESKIDFSFQNLLRHFETTFSLCFKRGGAGIRESCNVRYIVTFAMQSRYNIIYFYLMSTMFSYSSSSMKYLKELGFKSKYILNLKNSVKGY